jgi:nitrogen fixation protein NifB
MPEALFPDRQRSRHPCFHPGARGRYGRIHLPVAPACNIQCTYCNRAYDCTNESRPGVTSRVLNPEEAAAYLDEALTRMPYLSVVGIAGPGDAFADPQRTLATLELIRSAHPELHLCLSTNGLEAAEHVDALVDLKVGFVTVTVNAVDARVGQRIYSRVSTGGTVLRGRLAALFLIERQKAAIVRLKERGLTVKVNTVVIPGVNDTHTVAVAETVSRLKADLHNLIALIPLSGTPFQDIHPPSTNLLASLRDAAESFLPQMRHCVRCRSDAAGLLHEDRSRGVPHPADEAVRSAGLPCMHRNALESKPARGLGLSPEPR